jgi:hypothetical protein
VVNFLFFSLFFLFFFVVVGSVDVVLMVVVGGSVNVAVVLVVVDDDDVKVLLCKGQCVVFASLSLSFEENKLERVGCRSQPLTPSNALAYSPQKRDREREKKISNHDGTCWQPWLARSTSSSWSLSAAR